DLPRHFPTVLGQARRKAVVVPAVVLSRCLVRHGKHVGDRHTEWIEVGVKVWHRSGTIASPRRVRAAAALPAVVRITWSGVSGSVDTRAVGTIVDLERYSHIVEVTATLGWRRNVHFRRLRVGVLDHVLIAGPEEQFVFVLVEAE